MATKPQLRSTLADIYDASYWPYFPSTSIHILQYLTNERGCESCCESCFFIANYAGRIYMANGVLWTCYSGTILAAVSAQLIRLLGTLACTAYLETQFQQILIQPHI